MSLLHRVMLCIDCCGAVDVFLVSRRGRLVVSGLVVYTWCWLGQLLLLAGSLSSVDKGQVYGLGIQRGFKHCRSSQCWLLEQLSLHGCSHLCVAACLLMAGLRVGCELAASCTLLLGPLLCTQLLV